jgi:hypothetical protein
MLFMLYIFSINQIIDTHKIIILLLMILTSFSPAAGPLEGGEEGYLLLLWAPLYVPGDFFKVQVLYHEMYICDLLVSYDNIIPHSLCSKTRMTMTWLTLYTTSISRVLLVDRSIINEYSFKSNCEFYFVVRLLHIILMLKNSCVLHWKSVRFCYASERYVFSFMKR